MLPNAISPLDGRYAAKLSHYRFLQGEHSLAQARVRVECAWLLSLADNPQFTAFNLSADERAFVTTLISDFDAAAFARVKQIEQQSRHDVKAIEYYLAERCAEHHTLDNKTNFIHFACTSEDINNLAYAYLTQQARAALLEALGDISTELTRQARTYADHAMIARTHGQLATPTTMGKELANFAHRLQQQLNHIASCPILGKCNGASGNYNAHAVACPHIDWRQHSQRFIKGLGLAFQPFSTQIEPHDYLANLCSAIANANSILLDLCRDIWAYISLGYFQQNIASSSEVGSSTMPHKVNPIDFENAEGNLGIANALLAHLAAKLPISRLQRDLSDSTALRNLMPAFAYCLLAADSLQSGLGKIRANQELMAAELAEHWVLLAEPIQTVMRLHGIHDAYEQLKELTRGQHLGQEQIHAFIAELDIPETARQQLLNLTPSSYLGYAAELAQSLHSPEQ